VDPTRLELVTSAMRGRHEGLQGFSGACKTPANGSILMRVLFPAFQEIYSGCCTGVTALAQHKVQVSCYLTNRLEATYATFVLGIFSECQRSLGDVWGCIAPRAVVALGATAPHRCVESRVQEMHLLQIEHRISVEQVAHTVMEEHL
jgi:hypothetical protein